LLLRANHRTPKKVITVKSAISATATPKPVPKSFFSSVSSPESAMIEVPAASTAMTVSSLVGLLWAWPRKC
jgi:hypothetical protein